MIARWLVAAAALTALGCGTVRTGSDRGHQLLDQTGLPPSKFFAYLGSVVGYTVGLPFTVVMLPTYPVEKLEYEAFEERDLRMPILFFPIEVGGGWGALVLGGPFKLLERRVAPGWGRPDSGTDVWAPAAGGPAAGEASSPAAPGTDATGPWPTPGAAPGAAPPGGAPGAPPTPRGVAPPGAGPPGAGEPGRPPAASRQPPANRGSPEGQQGQPPPPAPQSPQGQPPPQGQGGQPPPQQGQQGQPS